MPSDSRGSESGPSDPLLSNDLGEEPREAGRRSPFYAFLLAEAVSVAGNRVAMLAIPWFVLETAATAALTGVSGFFFFFLPSAFAAVLAGAIIDRLDQRYLRYRKHAGGGGHTRLVRP